MKKTIFSIFIICNIVFTNTESFSITVHQNFENGLNGWTYRKTKDIIPSIITDERSYSGGYSFAVGPSDCGANCWNNNMVILSYTFNNSIYIDNFKCFVSEKGNWGGWFIIMIDDEYLTDEFPPPHDSFKNRPNAIGFNPVKNNYPETTDWFEFSHSINRYAKKFSVIFYDLTYETRLYIDDISINYAITDSKSFRCAAGNFRKNINDWGDQCVIYVRYETGIPWADFHGEARTCYQQAQDAGYRTGDVPKVSAIVVIDQWNEAEGQYGHVGIVTSIHGDSIEIRDSNWVASETVGEHTINTNDYPILGYIYCNSFPSVNLTIAQTPMSGPPGTTFAEWGTGFTPGGTATLHFEKPDGTEYPTQSINLDAKGHFELEYTAPYDKPVGVYKWWAIDDTTGLQSNVIEYEITSGGQSAGLEGTIYDQNTGTALSGAEVSLGGQSTFSDASGQYAFSSLEAGTYSLEVVKNGYTSNTESIYLPPDSSSTENIWLSAASGGQDIQITDISCRYPGEVVFLEGVGLDVSYTATVAWGGHPPEKVIFRTSNNTYEVPISGSSASIDLNIGSEFAACESLTVQAVSSNGETSVQVEAPVQIAQQPPPYDWILDSDSGETVYYQSGTGYFLDLISDGVEAGVIPEEIPLFGEKPFQMDWLPKIESEVNSGGETELELATDQFPKLKFSGFSVDFNSKFDLEGRFADCEWDYEGTLKVSGKTKLKKSWPFICPGPIPIPMYAKASLKVKADAELGILDIDPVDLNGAFGIGPDVRGSLGAGLDSKFAVEGWIGGGADMGLQWPQTPTLEQLDIYLNGGVTAYALLWKWEKEALRWDWSLTQQSQSVSATPTSSQEAGRPKLIPRGYVYDSKYGQFVASEPVLERQSSGLDSPEFSTMQALQTTIFPHSEPFLSASNDQVCLSWLFDDPERTAENRTLAVASFWDGSVWNEPVGIADDGTADFHPQLLSLSNGTVVAAWENEKSVLPEGAAFEDMIQNLEIAAAIYDSNTGTWQPQELLTDNSYIDSAPRLAGQTGSVLLTWIGNTANALRGNSTTPDALYFSSWNGTGWTESSQVMELPHGVVQYDLDFNGTTATAVFSLDMDGNATSLENQELFSLSYTNKAWGTLNQVTNNTVSDSKPQLARDQNGDLIMVWYQDGDLVSQRNMDPDTGQVITAGDYSTNQADFQLAAASNGQMAVVWAEASDYSSDIHAVFYDPIFGVWGNPKVLTDDTETEQYLTAAFPNPQTLMVVYDRTQMAIETSVRETLTGRVIAYQEPVPVSTDLYLAQYELHGDLKAGELDFQPGNPAPGSEMQLDLLVSNQGDQAASEVPVTLYQGDPGEGQEIGQTTVQGILRPGNVGEAVLAWTVPESDVSIQVVAVVDPDNTFEDVDRMNNQVNGTFLAPDLTLSTSFWEHIAGTNYQVGCRVKNIGPLPADASILVLRKGDAEGPVIGSQAIPALNSLESYEIVETVDMPALSLSVLLQADADGVVSEYDESNNEKEVVLSGTDSDSDGLSDGLEETMCTDPNDADTDDDGILDGTEDADHDGVVDAGETNPCDRDTDNDGIQDGTEIGLEVADVGEDTNLSIFKPDTNPSTTTDPLDDDTDNDGFLDGEEDVNGNGDVDPGEMNPDLVECPVIDESRLQTLFAADFENNDLDTFPTSPSPGPGSCIKHFTESALVEDGLGDNASRLLVLDDTDASDGNVAVYCELDRAVRGPVILEWDAVVVSKAGDGQNWVYATDGLGSDPGTGGPVLFEIPLIGNDYQDNGNTYALTLNQSHHFKVVLDTKKQQYCVWIDDQPLAVNVSFDDKTAEDFYTLGLGTFDTSTAELGIDNILIKGRKGMALPGVNLLLLD